MSKTEQRGEDLHVWVKAQPVDGRANDEVIDVLAELHGVPRSGVRLTFGATSKTKVFELHSLSVPPGRPLVKRPAK